MLLKLLSQIINKSTDMWIFHCLKEDQHKIMYWNAARKENINEKLWVISKSAKDNCFDLYENEQSNSEDQTANWIKISTSQDDPLKIGIDKWKCVVGFIYQKIKKHIDQSEKIKHGLPFRINMIHIDASNNLKQHYNNCCIYHNEQIIKQISQQSMKCIYNYFIEPFAFSKRQHTLKNESHDHSSQKIKKIKRSLHNKIKTANKKSTAHQIMQKFKQFVSQYSRMARCRVLTYDEYMLLEVLMSAYTETTQIIQPSKDYELLIKILKELNREEIMHLMSVFMYQIYFKHESKIKEWESCHNLYFVMDTNILLDLGKSKIETIMQLFKDNNIRIVIPNIVMQEIDQLKTKNDPVSKTSRDLSEMMYREFSNDTPNTFYVLSSYIKCNRFTNNDDMIIKETLDLHKQKRNSLFTIVTSDKNLLVKCMSKKINCMNMAQFINFCEITQKK